MKVQDFILFGSLISLIQSAIVVVTEIKYVTVSRVPIINDLGTIFTEVLLEDTPTQNPEPTPIIEEPQPAIITDFEQPQPPQPIVEATVITQIHEVVVPIEEEQPQLEPQPQLQPQPQLEPQPEPKPQPAPQAQPEPQQKQKQEQAPVQSGPSFAQEILNAHNQKRSLHGVPPLIWDENLYNYAQNYANQFDQIGFKHSGGPYGENLALGLNDATSVVNMWYSEIKYYSWNHQYSSSTGHFSQVVWKSTSKLGCGRSGNFWICSYSSPGNLSGAFAQNVLPLV
ncbi:PRY1 [Candida jiufengensis]|uniref:PRY1 n=1 Tax=Candida jiufengensis TaxID=497108 RepID=UPI0022245009|nr:PRY1 [Candida jiufengensis]KAI5951394.1 PRY1 [Candida jiufengensis]